ncbi:MAG: carboxypeptidase regulatory-like domain-containing protein [Bacteroidota bacterium]
MRFYQTVLHFWAAILLFVPAVAAQHTGTLSGNITSSEDAPLADVQVTLINTSLTANTNEAGAFFLAGILPGTYTVQVQKSGFETKTFTNLVVHSGATRVLQTELDAASNATSTLPFPTAQTQSQVIGTRHVLAGQELTWSPSRGAAAFGRTRAGIATFDGFDDLYVRGTRADQIDYFLNGIRLEGDAHRFIPEAAIQQITVETGHLDASYGDLLSGAVNISTHAGNAPYFGNFEALTSESLDPFGYSVFSGALGGSWLDRRVSLFVAGEYNDQLDSAPSAIGQLQILPAVLEDLRNAPMALQATTQRGEEILLPLPAALNAGATILVDDNGLVDIQSDQIVFSDGTRLAAADIDPQSLSYAPVMRANYLTPDQFSIESAKLGRQQSAKSFIGTLAVQPLPRTRLQLQGRFYNTQQDEQIANINQQVIFAPEIVPTIEKQDAQWNFSLSQHLGAATFVHVYGDFWKNKSTTFDRRFGRDWDALLEYGNIDSPVYDVLRGYKNLQFVNEIRVDDHGTPGDPSDDTEFTVRIPAYNTLYEDGSGPPLSDEVVASLAQVPGGRFNSFEQAESNRFQIGGYLKTQQANHALEAGFLYEKRTHRFWQLNAPLLARFSEGSPLELSHTPPIDRRYPFYSSVPYDVLNAAVGVYYGYDITGQGKVNSEDLTGFLSSDPDKPLEAYNLKPYQPITYAGYVQDKIVWEDVVLSFGLRGEVFDNNIRVLKDPFSRLPICRAGNIGSTVNDIACGEGSLPITVDEDFAVYFVEDQVSGYRDNEGNFYSAGGIRTDQVDGSARRVSNTIETSQFEDYKPQFALMPRVGVNLLVHDDLMLFASYNVLTQAPYTNSFATLAQFAGGRALNNTGLKPERMRKIELGFDRSVGLHRLRASLFVYRGSNLVSLRVMTPATYWGANNRGTSTSKGLELHYALRGIKGLTGDVSYTYSIAEGTRPGSHSLLNNYFSTITSNHTYPQDFDQRHNLNVSLAYAIDKAAGPQILGIYPFENLHIAADLRAASGFPYTAATTARPLTGETTSALETLGNFNGVRMPATTRLDLQINRSFHVQQTQATLFFQVLNLFDHRNVNQVWPFTGNPNYDGFLSSTAGQSFLESQPAVAETLYQHRSRVPNWVGIPRLIRLGLNVTF